MTKRKVIVKKYENRRLYDSTNSRYVNLDEVAQMVRNGDDVQVLDAATGEDLTRLILTQIVVEHAKGPDSAFPLDMLRQMVVASGRATQETTLKYMKAMMDMYQNAYRVMAPPLNPFGFMRAPASAEPETEEPANTRTAEMDQPGMVELRRRVAELEALVSRTPPQKGKKRAQSKRPVKRRKS